MVPIPVRLRKSVSMPLHIVLCASAALLIVWACSRALGRAPWLDEVMLFGNYPLRNIMDGFRPLRLYDQAATPLYSILYGWTASLPVEAIRAIHASTLLLSSLAMLSWKERSGLAIAAALIAVMAFPAGFSYMFEMKHYALEAVGALGIISWYANKDIRDGFGFADCTLFLLLTLLGISTLPVSGLALGLYLLRKVWAARQIKAIDVCWASATIAFLLAYYVIVKKSTVFQFSNYPGPYEYSGFVSSVKVFIAAILGLMPFGGIGGLGLLALWIYLAFERGSHQRILNLLVLSAWMAIVFAILAGINLYPVKYPRHIIWASAMAWVVTYESLICFFQADVRPLADTSIPVALPEPLVAVRSAVDQRIITIAATCACVFFALSSLGKLSFLVIKKPLADTHHAILYVMQSPIKDVALYGGAQAVQGFYSKRYSGLTAKRYIGEMKAQSVIALPPNSLDLESLKINIDRPGAYARFWQGKADRDGALREVLSKAPKNREFLLFSYFSGRLNEKKRKVIKDSKCQISELHEFGEAYVAKAMCASSSI